MKGSLSNFASFLTNILFRKWQLSTCVICWNYWRKLKKILRKLIIVKSHSVATLYIQYFSNEPISSWCDWETKYRKMSVCILLWFLRLTRLKMFKHNLLNTNYYSFQTNYLYCPLLPIVSQTNILEVSEKCRSQGIRKFYVCRLRLAPQLKR